LRIERASRTALAMADKTVLLSASPLSSTRFCIVLFFLLPSNICFPCFPFFLLLALRHATQPTSLSSYAPFSPILFLCVLDAQHSPTSAPPLFSKLCSALLSMSTCLALSNPIARLSVRAVCFYFRLVLDVFFIRPRCLLFELVCFFILLRCVLLASVRSGQKWARSTPHHDMIIEISTWS
jgi:hypothetical protein